MAQPHSPHRMTRTSFPSTSRLPTLPKLSNLLQGGDPGGAAGRGAGERGVGAGGAAAAPPGQGAAEQPAHAGGVAAREAGEGPRGEGPLGDGEARFPSSRRGPTQAPFLRRSHTLPHPPHRPSHAQPAQLLCGIAERGAHVHLMFVYRDPFSDGGYDDNISLSYKLPVREDSLYGPD